MCTSIHYCYPMHTLRLLFKRLKRHDDDNKYLHETHCSFLFASFVFHSQKPPETLTVFITFHNHFNAFHHLLGGFLWAFVCWFFFSPYFTSLVSTTLTMNMIWGSYFKQNMQISWLLDVNNTTGTKTGGWRTWEAP